MLEVKNLSKTYVDHQAQRFEAIHDISLNIADHQFVAIVGMSGCGKTTLLKCIAGLLPPTSGEVTLEKEKIVVPTPEIGMVFQEFSLFPWLTVKQNIEFGVRIKGVLLETRQHIVEQYLDRIGLNTWAESYPKVLSGGMKQRVALARTLANNPKIILMDEPFGSLDAQTRSRMQEFLINLWEHERKTILFVTHDIEEALFLADRVIILSGKPATVVKDLLIPFTRPRRKNLLYTSEFAGLRKKVEDCLVPSILI